MLVAAHAVRIRRIRARESFADRPVTLADNREALTRRSTNHDIEITQVLVPKPVTDVAG